MTDLEFRPTQLLVVDDDSLVLGSLRRYFATVDDIEVVAEAHNGVDALRAIKDLNIDTVLADIHMPEMDGLTLLREIQKLDQPPTFVAMTALDADETMLDVLSNGGAAYVVKSARASFIIDTVRQAAAGGTVVSSRSLSRLIGDLPDRPTRKLPELSNPEARVLAMLCDGLSNAVIAQKLGYAEGTVKKHVSTLIHRFGASSRLNLVVIALRRGFIPEDVPGIPHN